MRTAARSATSTRFMPFKVALAHNLEEKNNLETQHDTSGILWKKKFCKRYEIQQYSNAMKTATALA